MASRNKYILSCRLCNQNKLSSIIDFGCVPLGNNLQTSKKKSNQILKYPLSINQCINCNHFQLNYSVDPDLLYATNYTYLTGVGKSFKKHLEKFADDAIELFFKKNKNKNKKLKIIDIGSNDGTALSFFHKKGYKVLGVDPAKIPSALANKNGINTINDFFSSKLAKKIIKEYKLSDLVISNNVLAHIDKIHDVFEGIYSLLKFNGLLVFEVGYFGDIVKKAIYDTIYHEHLDYHSKIPLAKFLLNKGFSVYKIKTNAIQGGSIRVYCIKEKNIKIYPKVFKQFNDERNIFTHANIKNWVVTIFRNVEIIKKNINDANKNGINVWGYGAPTKATLMIKMLGSVGNSIEFILDDNAFKENKYIPGTNIPIIKKSKRPVYDKQLILCFAWNFFDDILSKLKLDNIEGNLLNTQNGEIEKI